MRSDFYYHIKVANLLGDVSKSTSKQDRFAHVIYLVLIS